MISDEGRVFSISALCIGPLQTSELNASGWVDALHTRPLTESDFFRFRFHIAESCHERLLCGVVRLDVVVLNLSAFG